MMNYKHSSPPKLENGALVTIAAMLLKQCDIGHLSTKVHSFSENGTQVMSDAVTNKIEKLQLPEILKNKLFALIILMWQQILAWKDNYIRLGICFPLPNTFTWTQRGMINNESMANILVRDTSLDIYTRYILACVHCLESEIPILWEQLDPEQKDMAETYVRLDYLTSYWSYHNTGKLDLIRYHINGIVPHEYAFQYSAFRGLGAATRYFFKKLDEPIKQKILMRTAQYVAYKCSSYSPPFPNGADLLTVLLFLLSQVDKDKQKEVFYACPTGELKDYVDSHWQDFL